MSAVPVSLRLSSTAVDAWVQSLANAPSDGGACVLLKREEVADLIHDARAARQLLNLIDTPELIDFPKAVHRESVHQVQRWGSDDRKAKEPYDWHWLLAHLAGRALEHHKEAERLAEVRALYEDQRSTELFEFFDQQQAHHREKAVHHTITAAAVLSHWHASIVGKHTGMQPGSATAATEADRLVGDAAA